MIYLKKFETHQEYEAYIQDRQNLVLPNVSFCEDTPNEVHYNPIETRLVVYYDIQDISSPTTIFSNFENSVKSIEIDGSETVSEFAQGGFNYQFHKVGEHVVKYEFNDPTTIGKNAPLFYNVTTIKQVEIPSTFTSIGSSAFNACSGLTSVTIPNSVTHIGGYAFNACSDLTSVAIGSGVTNIGDGVFNGCSGLTSVTIPNRVTSIGQLAFGNCSSLTSITIPSGVTSIGASAFYGCASLSSATVNRTTPPTLGDGAFTNTNDCPIYVPSSSVDDYQGATNWSTYASRIQAIPIQ